MIRCLPSSCALFLSLVAALPLAAQAAEPQPSYQCLPDDTVAVIRVPEGRKFVDAFRGQTKLGAVLLNDKRFEGVVNLVREQAGENWTELSSSLAKYSLKIEDFPKLFDKELGYAIVIEPRGKETPFLVGLAWAEPDSDLSTRLLAAIQQAAKEDEDVRRVDFQLEGYDVMQLTTSITGSAANPEFDVSELQGLSGEQIRAKLAEKREQADEKKIELDQSHVFITRIGDRLLMANTFANASAKVRAQLAEDATKQIDFAALTGVEQAKGVFARFLAAHTGAPSGLTPKVMSTPGVAAALPDGLPLFEALFSPEPLMKLARDVDDPTVIKWLKTLGIDRLGPMAWRSVLDRGALRTGFFVSMPTPREGLLALLDQPTFTADPPSWVPATAMGFGQISFDLGKAYTLVRDLVLREGGDEAAAGVQQIEQQVLGVTQVDLPTFLSSVGTNHYFLSFTPSFVKSTDDDGEQTEQPVTRQGLVWQLKDEAPWKRVIQLGAGLAGMSNGAVTASEEQGFIGLRAKALGDMLTGGVFVGHGYMLLGIGPDVVEPLMSAVRTPLEGAASFRGGELVKRAAALAPDEPCIYYGVMDFDRYIKVVRQAFVTAFDRATGAAAFPLAAGGVARTPLNEDAQRGAAKVKELLPSDEELDGATGASMSRMTVNQHGLVYQSALELPPQ